MHMITLRRIGNCFVDLMWTAEDGWWIEEVQPTFTRVSRRYDTEADARAAFVSENVEWETDN